MACGIAAPAAAQDRPGGDAPRVDVSPYINLSQVLIADLSNGDDALTYTSAQAGIDATIQTRRTQAQLSYNYEYRFAWDDDLADTSIHTGLARLSTQVTPSLGFEVGGIATRARSDIRGAAPGLLVGNVANISQLYGVYGGPTVTRQIDQFGFNAAYRVGYTKVEVPDSGVGLLPGQPRLDYYDDSLTHLVTASLGTRAGTYLPIGFTLSGQYEREDAGQLDQRYEGYFGRGDVVLPVSGTLALTAGVGYERIQISQRDPLVDGNGNIAIDGNGRFVTDEGSPRRLAYDIDGVFYDAGVVWRPSPRTTLEVHLGERYGTFSGTGSLSWQMNGTDALQVVVYDSVQSFGRQLGDGISALPTSFTNPFNGGGNAYNGCIFGSDGGAAGGCLNSVFQSISTANYRARGIDAVYAVTRGQLRLGAGAGYANRRFFAPDDAPGVNVSGLEDESAYIQAFASRQLDGNSGVTADVFYNWYRAGLGGFETRGAGATGAYYRNWGRLDGVASAGIYVSDQSLSDADVVAQALIGLGYRF
ncbi:hypothetical protein COC42_04095 [Sphingomonas spermidinifaciens]|uniref:Preprotein translocase subunit YajC n=1 Tax=Sphingomonas spermidinifaciens TaxID=1141889 RepID=A0A2A4BAN3_9SPHN|nr:hypothetical protein COC42_04095 [Sphingomonas spermidinifaciens]